MWKFSLRILKYSLPSECFDKISKSPVFSLAGNLLDHFLCAVGPPLIFCLNKSFLVKISSFSYHKKERGGGVEILRPPDWPQFRPPAGQETNFFLRVAWVPCIDLLSVSLVTSDLVPFPFGLSQLVPFAPCLYRDFSPHNFLLTFGPWPAHNIGGHKYGSFRPQH